MSYMTWSSGDRWVATIGMAVPLLVLLALVLVLRTPSQGPEGPVTLAELDDQVQPAAAPLVPVAPAAAEPETDVACSLTAAHPAPVSLGCQAVRVAKAAKAGAPASAWRVDLQIGNLTQKIVTGEVWVVASVRTADGKDERIASPIPQVFKAHTFTRKSFLLELPDAEHGTLTGVEAYVASGGGVVSFVNQAH
jgi:hypothetical protein